MRTQKNPLNETVLLSTQNKCLNWCIKCFDNFTPTIFVFTWPSNFISAEVEETMKYDRLLSAHYKYFVREMRIVAYNQLLESYSSLTLEYMANAFGVTIHFIDQ